MTHSQNIKLSYLTLVDECKPGTSFGSRALHDKSVFLLDWPTAELGNLVDRPLVYFMVDNCETNTFMGAAQMVQALSIYSELCECPTKMFDSLHACLSDSDRTPQSYGSIGVCGMQGNQNNDCVPCP